MSQATLGSTPYRNSSLFSGYYLDERIDDLDEWECDDEAREVFQALQDLWELEGELLPGYKEDELLSSWIDEILDILGFGKQSETTVPGGEGYNDRLLFDSDKTRREAAKQALDGSSEVMYGKAAAVLEAKQWGADFTKRFDESRSYRDASHQIKYYLEHTPERLQWGILTDGKKWRLYGTKDYATEIYYEIDLPELLETGDLEKFKYFYAFFRPAAFREVAGTTFLDTVWNESETAAQELGEDLQDNVFTALRVLGEGFVQSNDLDIDPDDEAAREELKEQSLVLLYRLMFVLYAESRGLIHPDDPESQAEYEEHFSLDQLRLEIHEDVTSGDSYDDYSGYATQMWSQLEDLFGLVDEGKDALGIPPYNGGLFDDEEHKFLADNEVADRYIAEVIHRLGTTAGEDGDPVLADYADLDTRHLGSIYEGLLEHEFRIADEPYAAVAEDGGQVWKPGTDVSVAEAIETVEEGELYVVNDDGERKATGAYYTPDYVVSYIVEETVDPLLDDIKAELEADGLEPSDQAYFGRFYSEVLELKILDPAMGSAHFLTSATAYLTEQVMEIVREQERQGRDEQEIRRTIAKECIYGVDVNGMAVELGKLSMWLETLAADKPLAFLDHHLKAGNSLVGSDISEVLSEDTDENGGQLTLTQAFARARQQTLEHVMDLMEELLAIDNEDLADIKSMEEIYDEIRADPLYQRLFEIANVHTAEEFGLDVPEGVYEEMGGAIDDEEEWGELQGEDWFVSAQAMAEEESFFHWELEFPEVFFGEDGEKIEDAGFDAVVGNPPYINANEMNKSGFGEQKEYWKSKYTAAHGAYDIYIVFFEECLELLSDGDLLGLITPNKYLSAPYGKKLRQLIADKHSLKKIADVSQTGLFPDASVYPIITLLASGDVYDTVEIEDGHGYQYEQVGNYDREVLHQLPDLIWGFLLSDGLSIISKIENISTTLGDFSDIVASTTAAEADEFSPAMVEMDSGGEELQKLVNTGTIDRYVSTWGREELTHQGSSFQKPALDLSHSRVEKRRIDQYNSSKLIFAKLGKRVEAMVDFEGEFASVNTNFAIESEPRLQYIAAICNSNLVTWIYEQYFGALRMSGGYLQFQAPQLKSIPIPQATVERLESEYESNHATVQNVAEECIEKGITGIDAVVDRSEIGLEHAEAMIFPLCDELARLKIKNQDINPQLRPYLGPYDDGKMISEIGISQPIAQPESPLQQTKDELDSLRVGDVFLTRESENTISIDLSARYKPDPDKKGADAYTETEPLPALRITDLTETEADLIEAFVPVAVDEAGGFAGFRETATKTNSLVDRLRKLTLPAVDDVRDGLASYIETKSRAEELETKIKRTDELIDDIVYELYGLTDEEIEIVEEAVGE